MHIHGKHYRTIWLDENGWSVHIIDQTKLPFSFETVVLKTRQDAAYAIQSMQVRGAPLIGVTAAYGLCLAIRENPSDHSIAAALEDLASQRPTAINLCWALEKMWGVLRDVPEQMREQTGYLMAGQLADDDIATNKQIGAHGLKLIEDISSRKNGKPVNILTHCNAGWLACVDWGTATSPIYQAHEKGIKLHVWVDETRPRNQGASLTAYELGAQGVPHTLIVDNAGGHLMQQGEVDLCLVGADRVAANGDICNKIGTYLKALAAHDNKVPFYVTLPYSTIDWSLADGLHIPIEERGAGEVLQMTGRLVDGSVARIDIAAEGSSARNFAFDVTPARLVTGLITERGICNPSQDGLLEIYPEKNII